MFVILSRNVGINILAQLMALKIVFYDNEKCFTTALYNLLHYFRIERKKNNLKIGTHFLIGWKVGIEKKGR